MSGLLIEEIVEFHVLKGMIGGMIESIKLTDEVSYYQIGHVQERWI